MKILKLTIKRGPFRAILAGIKKEEHRRPSEWIKSRIYNKDGTKREYDFVSLTNGYGRDKPNMLVEFLGTTIQAEQGIGFFDDEYNTIDLPPGTINIQLGEIEEINGPIESQILNLN